MDLQTFFRVVVRRWWLVVTLGVLGLVAGLVGAAVTPSVYESSTTLLLTAESTDPAATISSTTTAAAQAMPTVLGLVRSDLVLAPAAEELGTTAAALRPRVSVENDTGTFIITIAVTGSSPSAAHDAAAVVSEQLGDAVRTSLSSGGSTTYLATSTVSPASQPTAPVEPVRRLWAAGGLLAGLLAGVVAAFVLRWWTGRRRGAGPAVLPPADVPAAQSAQAAPARPVTAGGRGKPAAAGGPHDPGVSAPGPGTAVPADVAGTGTPPPRVPPAAPSAPGTSRRVTAPPSPSRTRSVGGPAVTRTGTAATVAAPPRHLAPTSYPPSTTPADEADQAARNVLPAAALAALEADQTTRDALPQDLREELIGVPAGHGSRD